MFRNNYKAVFELLGNNEKSNSFEEESNQKIKANILANQPAKFEYLTEFKDEDESGLEERLRRINSVCSFTIQTAKAQTARRDSETAKTITVKHWVYRAMDRTTGLQFDFKAEQNTWHVQRIAWKDYNKPKGYYSAKAAMKRFKKELLDGLGKDYAYGRSVASQYPVKRNRFGDWRGKLANIKDKKGKRSKGLTRLSGFYLRCGWLPIYTDDFATNGMMIYLPSEEFKRSNLTDKQLKEYSKYADNSTKH
jgi:hypothetical protein